MSVIEQNKLSRATTSRSHNARTLPPNLTQADRLSVLPSSESSTSTQPNKRLNHGTAAIQQAPNSLTLTIQARRDVTPGHHSTGGFASIELQAPLHTHTHALGVVVARPSVSSWAAPRCEGESFGIARVVESCRAARAGLSRVKSSRGKLCRIVRS